MAKIIPIVANYQFIVDFSQVYYVGSLVEMGTSFKTDLFWMARWYCNISLGHLGIVII